MFSIICKKRFKARHSVKMTNGDFEDSHEHDWLVECKISSEKLNNDGFVADFAVIDEKLDKIITILTNSDLNCVDGLSPASAENLAFFIHSKLKSSLGSNDIVLKKIKVWEDESHGASYKV